MIGDGPDFPEIKTLAQNQSNIVLMGRRSDIPSLMKTFDCVILPSLPGEGFPVTMIELKPQGADA
ncbi:MAG: glycosyltransferase [Subdoligranulum sp.]